MTRRCRLRARRSRFVEIFRTTPAQTVCPNFYVLAHADGCLFRPQCSYCYLKSSFWFLRAPEAFSNINRMVSEVTQWIGRDGLESHMLNAGNLCDSLAFEEARPLMVRLIEAFRRHGAGRPHTLLLVTKGGTRHCRSLLGTTPCAGVVISFSVNAPDAARKFESGAASTADRLRAAEKLKTLGWRVRMRIDPMIRGFDYADIVQGVRELGPERVTLGTLRAEANLGRFVKAGLLSDLQPPGDGKGLARYPFQERLGLYRPAVDILKGACPIGLCEETREMWEALGLDADAKPCNCCR